MLTLRARRVAAAPVALATALLLAACSASAASQVDLAPGRRIPIPPATYDGLAWLPSGTIVLSYEEHPEAPGSSARLWRLRPDGSGFARLPLGADPDCRRTEYLEPTALADGRLGFFEWCDTHRDSTVFKITAYDLETARSTTLVKPIKWNPAPFTFDPTLRRGLFSNDGSICGGIGSLSPDGTGDFPVTVPGGGRVDAYFHSSPTSSCTEELRATQPAWSPDGRTIAFFASPQSLGVSGFDRLDVPWNLYLVSAGGRTARKVLGGVGDPHGLEWSPDGKALAFGGTTGDRMGAWVFYPRTRTLRPVGKERVLTVTWSPDSAHLLALYDPVMRSPSRFRLLVFDVGPPPPA